MGEVMRADDPTRIVRDLVAACEVVAAREGLAPEKGNRGSDPRFLGLTMGALT